MSSGVCPVVSNDEQTRRHTLNLFKEKIFPASNVLTRLPVTSLCQSSCSALFSVCGTVATDVLSHVVNHTSSSAACDDFWSATPLSPAAQRPALALDPGSDVVGCLGLSNAYAVRCLPSPVLSKLWLMLTLEPLTLLCACLVYPLFLSAGECNRPVGPRRPDSATTFLQGRWQ